MAKTPEIVQPLQLPDEFLKEFKTFASEIRNNLTHLIVTLADVESYQLPVDAKDKILPSSIEADKKNLEQLAALVINLAKQQLDNNYAVEMGELLKEFIKTQGLMTNQEAELILLYYHEIAGLNALFKNQE